MEERSNCRPSSSKEDVIMDAKPLRTLTPMFPGPLGLNTFSVPGDRPFICLTPVGQTPSDLEPGHGSGLPPIFPNFPATQAPNVTTPTDRIPRKNPNSNGPDANGPLRATPLSSSFQTSPRMVMPLDGDDSPPTSGHTSASGRAIKRPVHLSSYSMGGSEVEVSDEKKELKRKYRKKVHDHTSLPLLLSSTQDDPRESVEVVLMTFDALRRRLQQLDEVSNANKRPDLKAAGILMSKDLRANKEKRVGNVPGVEVGDIFYFRMETCLVGLHAPSMGGIDWLSGEDTIALSIVSAGGYDNEEGDVDILIYSGQGGGTGSKGEKKQMDNQKLERGNLALEKSLHRGNEIRVIRSAKDLNVLTGKIYIYDGLYKIQESWVEKAKTGFNVFKYKLLREPGQPDGLAVWKMTQKWRENPASRGRVILPDISSGIENIPVCLVNEVDDEKGPGHFTYVTRVKHRRAISTMKPLEGCICLSVCLPGDENCSCARQNGGDLPYSSTGYLVSRRTRIYECTSSCQCSVNCRNRVTQKGIKAHFEIFRTSNRGWGLRSWDPIRIGTFICEYTGEVVDKVNVDDDEEEDEYIFQATSTDEKAFKWNYGPELLGEPTSNYPNEASKPPPIIISAKSMGNISRFMNHSCSPNVFWQPVQHDHGDERYPHIMFFAMKHIPPMTELTYDYGLSGAENGRAKMCLCGFPKCRGLFG